MTKGRRVGSKQCNSFAITRASWPTFEFEPTSFSQVLAPVCEDANQSWKNSMKKFLKKQDHIERM